MLLLHISGSRQSNVECERKRRSAGGRQEKWLRLTSQNPLPPWNELWHVSRFLSPAKTENDQFIDRREALNWPRKGSRLLVNTAHVCPSARLDPVPRGSRCGVQAVGIITQRGWLSALISKRASLDRAPPQLRPWVSAWCSLLGKWKMNLHRARRHSCVNPDVLSVLNAANWTHEWVNEYHWTKEAKTKLWIFKCNNLTI